MLYEFAHFIRAKIPFLWDILDAINSMLFRVRYYKKLKMLSFTKIRQKTKIPENYKIIPISEIPTEVLVNFFASQPQYAYTFFKPHGFDSKSIKKLQKNSSFLAYVLIEISNNKYDFTIEPNCPKIVGYCFNRSFFWGKGFRGRMVDINHRGEGLGKIMNKILNEIGFGIGLRLFETVNKDNVASYKSAISASNVKVIEMMKNGDLFLEILQQK